jgi:hypothetical protein
LIAGLARAASRRLRFSESRDWSGVGGSRFLKNRDGSDRSRLRFSMNRDWLVVVDLRFSKNRNLADGRFSRFSKNL